MKVDFVNGEKKVGLIKRSTLYSVTVTTSLTDEERELIKKNLPSDTQILLYNYPTRTGMDLDFTYSVKDLLKGTYTHEFVAPEHAADFQQNILEQLKLVKEDVDAMAAGLKPETIPQDQSYDL